MKKLLKLKDLVQNQKNNSIIWSIPETPLERYLQIQLKIIHASIANGGVAPKEIEIYFIGDCNG